MARKKAGTTKALSVTLTLSNYATLEDLRWARRKTFSDMLDEVVTAYIEQNNIQRVQVTEFDAETGVILATDDAGAEKPAKPAK